MRKLIIPLVFFLMLSVNAYATATVGVTTASYYFNVTSGDYSTLNNPWYNTELYSSTPNIAYGLGSLGSIVIFNNKFTGGAASPRRLWIYNSTQTGFANLTMDKGSSIIIEGGPIRVMTYYNNSTNTNCDKPYGALSDEKVCMNFQHEIYSYSRNVLFNYVIDHNGTLLQMPGQDETDVFSLMFQAWMGGPAFNVINFTLDGIGSYAAAGDFKPLGIFKNTSLMFYPRGALNKTLFIYPTSWNSTNNSEWGVWIQGSETVPFIYNNQENVTEKGLSLGYGMFFGHNYESVITNSTTFTNDFASLYGAFRNPAAISTVTGTYEGRYNISGTYNFTPISNRVTFYFSTGTNNYTYPVFHIKNLDMTNTSHLWYKDVLSTYFARMINGSDVLVQKGNSSFFGYDYALVMPNMTLGTGTNKTYEFWFSNDTDPSGLNITAVYDEDTLAPLTFNVTIQNNTYYETKSNILNYYNSNLTGSLTVSISSVGYQLRNYYVTIPPLGFYNLTGYLLAIGTGANISYHIYSGLNPTGEAKAMIHALRNIGGVWTTVQELQSDDGGNGQLFLEPGVSYRINAESADGSLYKTIDSYFPDSTTTLNINLLGTAVPAPGYWDYYKKFTGSCSFDNPSRLLTCSWNDGSGMMSQVNVDVERFNKTSQSSLCLNTSVLSTGSILCSFGAANNNTFTWTMKAKFTGEEYMLIDSGSWTDAAAEIVLGLTGIVIAMLIVLFSGFIGVQLGSPVMTVLMTMIGVGISTLLGFLSFGSGVITMIMGFFIAGIVLIYKLRA